MGLGFSRRSTEQKGPVFVVRNRLYRVLATIGQGGEATVYRCEDQSATEYAVKVFYFSSYVRSQLPRRVKNFRKEAKILKYLSERSPHFVRLYDYEYKPLENVGYMIMELGEGNLRQVLLGAPMSDQYRRIYWKQIVTILKDLEEAHVVHADIKPENLILVNNVLKLADLGLAFASPSAQRTVVRPKVGGTLDYMAPEVFFLQTGSKSDVWSAGIILYEMSYGRPPFIDIVDRQAKIAAITSPSPIFLGPLADLYLFDCLKRCLNPDFRHRPTPRQLISHPYKKLRANFSLMTCFFFSFACREEKKQGEKSFAPFLFILVRKSIEYDFLFFIKKKEKTNFD
uniref:Serine-threonin kinase copy 1 n=1 Tax=Philodina roseola TaxID=96448 RepID=B2L3K0_PHIRO|nr:serine-threonin kinase copy 1 [Philodina roseola]